MNAPKPTVPADAALAETGASVDKIRDILFGGQMREYEGRFTEIEQRLFAETAQMRDELTQRLTRMEQELRAELRRLGEAALRERTERLAAQQTADLQLAKLAEGLMIRIDENAKSGGTALAELRETLSRELGDASRSLGRQLSDLDARHEHAKAGREELAGLLRQFAAQLEPAAE